MGQGASMPEAHRPAVSPPGACLRAGRGTDFAFCRRRHFSAWSHNNVHALSKSSPHTNPVDTAAFVWNRILPLDVETLRSRFHCAKPYRHIWMDDFLQPDFAQQVADAYPSYAQAREMGRQFRAVNENLKVQVTDSDRFPGPVRELALALSAPEFLRTVEAITGIEALEADPEFVGGGMHVMGSGGRLDVHVDFNQLPERGLHRRLNILVYLNPAWREEWGGLTDLWDESVRESANALAPIANRCLIFNTTESSFHGVTPLRCPPEVTRNSFAAYYYTRAEPGDGASPQHTTVFKPRPNELWRERILLPLERSARRCRAGLASLAKRFKG
jgi:hypothetical protein